MAKKEKDCDPSFSSDGDPTVKSLIAEGHLSIRVTLSNGSQGIIMTTGAGSIDSNAANRDILIAAINRMIPAGAPA